MPQYTYKCDCSLDKTIGLDYGSDVPKEIPCSCGGNMSREYKPTPIHFKGLGWGSDKTGEK